MMDGDPPSISLVFRRPVTHPTHPGLRWDLVSCWLSFHFVPRVRFRCRRTVSRATAPCVAYTPARSLRQHLKSSAFAFIGVFHPVSAWLSTKLISGSLSPTITKSYKKIRGRKRVPKNKIQRSCRQDRSFVNFHQKLWKNFQSFQICSVQGCYSLVRSSHGPQNRQWRSRSRQERQRGRGSIPWSDPNTSVGIRRRGGACAGPL